MSVRTVGPLGLFLAGAVKDICKGQYTSIKSGAAMEWLTVH